MPEQPWHPITSEEAAKAERGEVYKGIDGNEYKSPMPKPVDLTATAPSHPDSTLPSAEESAPVVGGEAAAHAAAAPASLPNTTSHGIASTDHVDKGRDTDKHDSMGKEKLEEIVGPRGDNAPLDVLTPEQKQAIEDKQAAKLRAGGANTHNIDTIGNKKTDNPVHVGPRGKGVPKDTYHSG